MEPAHPLHLSLHRMVLFCFHRGFSLRYSLLVKEGHVCHIRWELSCKMVDLHAGTQKEAAKAEPRAYQSSAAQQKARGLFAAAGSSTDREPSHTRPAPRATPVSGSTQPAIKPMIGRQPPCRGSGQPVSMKHGGLASRPSSAQAGQQGRKSGGSHTGRQCFPPPRDQK